MLKCFMILESTKKQKRFKNTLLNVSHQINKNYINFKHFILQFIYKKEKSRNPKIH